MVDDVLLNKVAIVERCLARIQDEYAGDERNLRENLTRQDSIILNLQRACEAVIDLAMAQVKDRRLGPPQESRHAFELLRDAGLIDGDLARRMPGMVGFRNVAVRDYLVAIACIGASVDAARAADGTMTWGVHVSLTPAFFDPADATGTALPLMVYYGVHDALVRPMPGTQMGNALAYPEVEFDAVNAIPANPYTAPYEDLRLKALSGARR
jgi:uncharacterized protein YutE (UPF0331/DUF86 family)